MANGIKYQAHEILNKVLNSAETGLQVDIVAGAEYAEDASHTSTDTGNFVLGVRNDTLAALGGADGDYVAFQMNADGALYVDVANGGVLESAVDGLETLLTGIDADTDAIKTDAAAIEVLLTAANVDHAANEALLTTIDEDTNAIKGHVDGIETLITSTNSKIDTFDAVLDNILTKNTEIDTVLDTIKVDTEAIETAVELLDNAIDGSQMQVDVVAISAQSDGTYIGDIKFGESLPAGSAAIGKLAANSGVDIGDVDVTSVVPGTGATNLGKAEDAAHSSGDTGVMALAVRNDDVAALAGADGDYSPLQVNAAGSLYTKDETGEAGSILVTGTTAVTSPSNTKFIAIQFIEDTVFDSGNDGLISATNQLYPSTQYTGTDIDGDGGAVADSVSFPQGMTIFGRWSGFKLASGKVIGYIGYV